LQLPAQVALLSAARPAGQRYDWKPTAEWSEFARTLGRKLRPSIRPRVFSVRHSLPEVPESPIISSNASASARLALRWRQRKLAANRLLLPSIRCAEPSHGTQEVAGSSPASSILLVGETTNIANRRPRPAPLQ
jgi:hypothetical protein